MGSTGNTANSTRPRKERRITYVLRDSNDSKVITVFHNFVSQNLVVTPDFGIEAVLHKCHRLLAILIVRGRLAVSVRYYLIVRAMSFVLKIPASRHVERIVAGVET